jgi:hypothetical protein
MTKASPHLSVGLLLFALSNLQAEPQCPGNVVSVQYHSLGGSQMAIPVTIDGSGPYEFMVNTGSEFTFIDPALAADLHLQSQGSIGMTAVTTQIQAQLVVPETVEAGSHSVHKLVVAVSSLAHIQSANRKVRGVLGENFLAQFDLLIDYRQNIICLDESSRMRQALKGERIPLEAQVGHNNNVPFTQPYLVTVHVAGIAKQDTVFRLDSGAAMPLVYRNYEGMPSYMDSRPQVRATSMGAAHTYQTLKPADVKIGSRWLRQIVFVTPTERLMVHPGQDGLLPTALFQRVFLSYAERYAMLDPK